MPNTLPNQRCFFLNSMWDLSSTTSVTRIISFAERWDFCLITGRCKLAQVSGANLCEDKVLTSSLPHSNFLWRLARKRMNLLAKVCHGRFHDILSKNNLEHSLSFHGDYKKRCILTSGVSQILLLTQLIYEIKYIP